MSHAARARGPTRVERGRVVPDGPLAWRSPANVAFDQAHTFDGRAFSDLLVRPATIIDYLRRHATERPNATFIVPITDGAAGETVTYGSMWAQATRVARRLRGDLRVSSGTPVGVVARNDPTTVVAIFGVLIAGGIVLLLSPADPVERLGRQVSGLGSVLVLGDLPHHLHGVEVADPAAMVRVDRDGVPATTPTPSIRPHDPAVIAFTSGSTAVSKAVLQAHYNLAVNCVALVRHHALAPTDRLICCLPLHHVNGLEFTIFATVVAGASVLLCDRFQPFNYVRTVRRHHPNIASVVPSILRALADADVSEDLASLRYFVSAAAPLSHSTAVAVHDNLGKQIVQGYGLSETTNFTTSMSTQLRDAEYRRLCLEVDVPPVGGALFGNSFSIRDDEGRAVPDGEIGEVCIRGHNVMLGYAFADDETDHAFRGGWFHSGDLGRVMSDVSGRCLTIEGRLKNIVKVGGVGVSLDELDRVLTGVSGVADAVTFATPDEYLGERVSAAVVPSARVPLADLLAALRKELPEEAVPAEIFEVRRIPRTLAGKVQRAMIADWVHRYARVRLDTHGFAGDRHIGGQWTDHRS